LKEKGYRLNVLGEAGDMMPQTPGETKPLTIPVGYSYVEVYNRQEQQPNSPSSAGQT